MGFLFSDPNNASSRNPTLPVPKLRDSITAKKSAPKITKKTLAPIIKKVAEEAQIVDAQGTTKATSSGGTDILGAIGRFLQENPIKASYSPGVSGGIGSTAAQYGIDTTPLKVAKEDREAKTEVDALKKSGSLIPTKYTKKGGLEYGTQDGGKLGLFESKLKLKQKYGDTARLAGKTMPAGTATRLADYDSSSSLLNDFDDNVKELSKTRPDLFNPYQGGISTFTAEFRNDSDARAYNSSVTALKQMIGKALEGGVLRQEDTKKYDKILGKAGTPADALLQISQEIRQKITSKKSADLNSLQKAGYDVSGFVGEQQQQQPKRHPIIAELISKGASKEEIDLVSKELGL